MSNNSNTDQHLVRMYTTHIPNVPLDKKLLNYWTNAIQRGDKTMHDFTSYLSKNTDYLNYVKLRFTDMYYDHFSCSGDTAIPDVNTLYENMMLVNRERLLTSEDIWKFITDVPAFAAQYTDIVTKLFASVHNREPSSEETVYFFSKVKGDQTYTIDKLHQDIRSIGVEQPFVNNPSRAVVDDVVRAGGADAAAADGAKHLPVTQAVLPSLSFQEDIDIVEMYEAVTQRNMNVREYILYIEDMRAAKNQKQFIEDLYAKQTDQFNRVKEMMHLYLERYLTEEAFIAQCLPRIHADVRYVDTLKAEVIDSDEYQSMMTQKLQAIYQSLYGESMEADDVSYLFARVKHQKLQLLAEGLTEMVAEFKTENDELLQRIFDVFFLVLDREPDASEQAHYMTFIRNQMSRSKEDIEDKIARDLKESLEFHDILKRKITADYAKHRRDTLFPSKIYAVLQRVLPAKHSDGIDEYIAHEVQELIRSATPATPSVLG
jgi:hypothetical protein